MAGISLENALKELGMHNDRVDYYLPSLENVSLNDDGTTWTKIPNMILDGNTKGFSVTTGTLKKTDNDNICLAVGISDVSVNKACKIYYGLSINGADPLADHITPHTFTAGSKISTVAINKLPTAHKDDEFEILILGDGVTSSVTATVTTLNMTFWGK